MEDLVASTEKSESGIDVLSLGLVAFSTVNVFGLFYALNDLFRDQCVLSDSQFVRVQTCSSIAAVLDSCWA